MHNILLTFALEQESAKQFESYQVLYTGVGKVQAAMALSGRLQQCRPSIVINLGTAGSNKHPKGSIINATTFVQRDMDVTALGFSPYETPFSHYKPAIEYGEKIRSLPQGTCGTGDSFSVNECFGRGAYDLVDMEAYVLSVICQKQNVPFLCLKYISDSADGEADQDWEASLLSASQALKLALTSSLAQLA